MEKGDKYIIEIAEVIEADNGMKLGRVKGFDSLVMTEYGLDQLEKVEPVKKELKPLVQIGSVVKFDYVDCMGEHSTEYGVVTLVLPQSIEVVRDNGEVMGVGEWEVVDYVGGAFHNLMASLRTAANKDRKEKK